jgi:hypothetical protein
MKIFNLLGVIFFLIVSCKEERRNQDDPVTILNQFGSAFSQTKSSLASSDTNTLVFSKMGRWQRSYIFTVKKSEGQIRALMQELDFDKYDEGDTLHKIYFKGFSFNLDQREWGQLMGKATALLNKTKSEDYHDRMLDANIYVISFDGKTLGVNTSERTGLYEGFSEYILNEIIGPKQ